MEVHYPCDHYIDFFNLKSLCEKLTIRYFKRIGGNKTTRLQMDINEFYSFSNLYAKAFDMLKDNPYEFILCCDIRDSGNKQIQNSNWHLHNIKK